MVETRYVSSPDEFQIFSVLTGAFFVFCACRDFYWTATMLKLFLKSGPVKIYAQIYLQAPADLKSAGNRGIVHGRLQVLHVHVFLVAPLGACHVA